MLLEGKRGLILGVANKRSIAWGIAQAVAREGARAGPHLPGRAARGERPRAGRRRSTDPVILPCDVTRDEDLDALAASVQQELGGLDFVVHAVAFALREELDGEFLNTSREGYRIAQDISSYSLTALARRVAPLMEGSGGSIVTLSYLGGERVVPHYNVMGVAKAALEMSVRYLAVGPGPARTSASTRSPPGPSRRWPPPACTGSRRCSSTTAPTRPCAATPTRTRSATPRCSWSRDLSRGVTGEVIHVDGGFHVMGMSAL